MTSNTALEPKDSRNAFQAQALSLAALSKPSTKEQTRLAREAVDSPLKARPHYSPCLRPPERTPPQCQPTTLLSPHFSVNAAIDATRAPSGQRTPSPPPTLCNPSPMMAYTRAGTRTELVPSTINSTSTGSRPRRPGQLDSLVLLAARPTSASTGATLCLESGAPVAITVFVVAATNVPLVALAILAVKLLLVVFVKHQGFELPPPAPY
ncbi:uncharacterized protein BXZ73DRAFT_108670 [Epithele typhae]|uniref:uncharacterized protein n=1 Tax=Epithele typhae TaxID=378194 RepID=UPI00200884A3|nr:uncharacterized protein BXZ73DRAFT_108670 [Epithele typhae]KAH9910667.1 hypothetical protein BXZ73DRAFT_108670 [Epithele typhae]